MIELKEIKNKKKWNDFIINSNFKFYSFLQSWEWWVFQELCWKKIIRYWIFEWKKQIWSIQIIKIFAKRANYYFIPHWPLFIWDKEEILKEVIKNLKNIAKKDKITFIRFNSGFKNTIENQNIFKKLCFKNAPMHEHAEDTHLLDLIKTEEELFSSIKKKDRYYINRAVKEWVEIKISNEKEQIETLIKMHHNHSHRTNWKRQYHAFSKEFIYNLYKSFWKENITTITASFNWIVESSLMTIKFWKTCVYYIAASNIKNPKFSPNYLCQWEAIKNAKQSWCETYNFWGISPDNNPKHPIAWVTKFKRKFNWYDYSLLHAQDYILKKSYYFNWVVETFRRIKRGYYYKKPE